jgi:Cu2+-containing amine oxidase
MWKDFGGVRRGEELVLWGAIDAANYRYIQEYTFRDDGAIIGRAGTTGQNLPGEELDPHVHNALWRIDIDLNGVTNNAAHLRHLEHPNNPVGDAADKVAVAQGFTWSPSNARHGPGHKSVVQEQARPSFRLPAYAAGHRRRADAAL